MDEGGVNGISDGRVSCLRRKVLGSIGILEERHAGRKSDQSML